MAGTNASLIDAIHHDRLAEIDDADAKAVCRAIGRRVAREVAMVIAVLADEGITASVEGDPTAPVQRHNATLNLTDADQAVAALRVLERHGYRPWEPIDGPAEPVLRRFRHGLTVARSEDVTMVLDLRWPPTAITKRLPAILIPNENDYRVVALPTWLWPLYLVIRPVRLVAERLGLYESSGPVLGPFLSTPTDLIDPLLDLADVGPEDVVVDLGCGDARILRQAVAERACRGVGVESDSRLAAEARRLVTAEGHSDRIVIIEGDATTERLPTEAAEGSVFFVFVPAGSVPAIAGRVLTQARPGSRLLVHEQHPLPEFGREMVSTPLLSGQGVTVAHRLDVPKRSTPGADRDP